MDKPDRLIRTKIHLPFTRPERVARPRLQERVAQGLRGPLTLVTAPAGFGKTTLVAACIASYHMPVAWLSLDINDNQIRLFLSYLVAALQEADPAIGGEAAQILAAAQQTPPEAVLTSLINDLDVTGRQMLLVLDDYQFIHSQVVHDQVTFLLEHCPHTFHLLIAARSDPPLPLSRMRARGQTVELRAADLCFTVPEAAQFLNDVMGLRLDAGAVKALADRTEGWIAGLQMAALSMRGHEDVPGFIKGFSGTNRYILDYLLEEVLASQPAEIQRFLLHTSILKRLTAPLCDAVTAGAGSQVMLEWLERANLFVASLDDERKWYRYHQLFSDLLRVRLQQTEPELLPILHTRAVEWYEGNLLATQAIEHAIAGKDWSKAAHLIEQQAMSSLISESVTPLISWLEAMPEKHLHGRPWLCVYRAWSLVLGCQIQGVEKLLVHAEQALRGVDNATSSADILGNIAMIRAYLALFEGDMQRVSEQAALADQHLPESDRTIRCDLYWVLGFPPFLHGDLVSAADAWARARDYSLDAGNPYLAVASMVQLGRLYRIQGRLQAALEMFQQSLEIAAERGWQHSRLTSFVTKDLADVYRERNDLSRATILAQEAVDESERFGNPSDKAMANTILAHVLCTQGQWEGSRQALGRAMQICRSYATYPGILSRIMNCQTRLWLVTGDLHSALGWFSERQLHPENALEFRLESEYIALARVLLFQDSGGKSAALLARLDDTARAGGRVGNRIEILALQARVLLACARTHDALSALSEALALAEPEGYVRVFLDEGQPMQLLLAQWIAHAGSSPLRGYAAHLLSQFETQPPAVPTAQKKVSSTGGVVEPLSQRELEVLQLMALGRTNQEIARQLIVAPGTIKAHAASIYRKLEAANRTEAVARARQLGLLH